jgi:RNA polymerase sigma factor (sigma-70 family)
VNNKGYPGDEAIIKAIILEDERAFNWLYKLNFPTVVKMVLQNSGNRDEASDLFQDAIVVFYENVKDGNFILKSSISTYLYAVCRHLWLKRLRQKGRSPMVYMDGAEGWDVKDDVGRFEEEELKFGKLSGAIDSIGEPCRSLLTDFYFKGLSMQDIAVKYEYTNAENAKNQKYKCLQRLKKLYFK